MSDDILDAMPPNWATKKAQEIAEITYPPITGCIVELIAMNLWLAYSRGKRHAHNSVPAE
jgi:hypothetical protein